MSSSQPTFLRDRHVKYWLRCAKTFLPEAYTSNDSNRMTLAFFIVSALDLLDILESKIDTEQRESWTDWIYSCQLGSGGFRGFTGTKIDVNLRYVDNQHWDPANVPATFFALLTLVVLGDDLSRVNRRECLAWLPKLQRDDGSFGETLGENGNIEGGSDLRFCCCAAGIRHFLRGPRDGDVGDFDVSGLAGHIVECQVSGLWSELYRSPFDILGCRPTMEASPRDRGMNRIVWITRAGRVVSNRLTMPQQD